MTCIVGWIENGTVWMGGDSAASIEYSWQQMELAETKVFKSGPMIFGICGSPRMGDILRWSLSIPDHDPRTEDRKYMATTFVDAVRKCFKDGGFAKIDNGVESGGLFLVGYKGRIYRIAGDFQVIRVNSDYIAVGCADDVAHGAMYASAELGQSVTPQDRLSLALRAAERWSAGVRAPFHIESLEPAAS